MYAVRAQPVVEGREFYGFGDARTVKFRGGDPVPVELTEDAEGQYWGWISHNGGKTGQRPDDGVPKMIQPHKGMFEMQSPDGFRQDVERGYGEVVRISCSEIVEGER
jgi:hypothetical protein